MDVSHDILIALIALGGAVIGVAASTITTLLIHRNERHKFARERVWDLRRDAYTIIVAALIRANRLADHIDKEYSDDPYGYDASKEMRVATGQYIEAMHQARDAFYANRLMLSDQFAARYDAMIDELNFEVDNPNLVPPEKAEETARIITNGTDDLLGIALKEVVSIR